MTSEMKRGDVALEASIGRRPEAEGSAPESGCGRSILHFAARTARRVVADNFPTQKTRMLSTTPWYFWGSDRSKSCEGSENLP
jgi:hypothetical protein